jgi:predicted AlkP superfamily pyrophosphatase or phosphodiesterase
MALTGDEGSFPPIALSSVGLSRKDPPLGHDPPADDGSSGESLLPDPLLPDYGGACVTNIMPALLEPPDSMPGWFPDCVADADQVLFLVLDGLGWLQLQERLALAPVLGAMQGSAISTVAPSTTSTAMTSITTGLTPGEHGVVGYRVGVDGQVLNVLRWAVGGRDCRAAIPPDKLQSAPAFLGHRPAVITRADFRTSGFTAAHLDGVRFNGYRVTSSLIVEARRLLRSGEPFVYAYYEGIDKVAHEYGLGEHYDAELHDVDRLVGELAGVLPRETVLVVTSDHGQLHVGDNIVRLDRDVLDQVSFQSGEGRFRWLHARPGRTMALLEAAQAHHGDNAWVLSQEQMVADGWFGPIVTDAARSRLGDVALVAKGSVSFHDPDDGGPFELISRHGSVTAAEMLVPLLAQRA